MGSNCTLAPLFTMVWTTLFSLTLTSSNWKDSLALGTFPSMSFVNLNWMLVSPGSYLFVKITDCDWFGIMSFLVFSEPTCTHPGRVPDWPVTGCSSLPPIFSHWAYKGYFWPSITLTGLYVSPGLRSGFTSDTDPGCAVHPVNLYPNLRNWDSGRVNDSLNGIILPACDPTPPCPSYVTIHDGVYLTQT